jgi:shikimate dehydrogenase
VTEQTGPGAAHRAAVLGKPIGHSLSPVIHNAGYAAAGLHGWSYDAHECGETELAGYVAGLGPSWAGLSLTMPLKEVALDVAATVSGVASALGAANTLVRQADGSWHAENTDAPGMVDALASAGLTRAARVSVLGAGGTARAALGACQELGASTVTVYARRPEALAELEPVASALGLRLIRAAWSAASAAGEADLVISTVPRGVADSLVGAVAWQAGTVLFDAVYDPWPTPLAAAAARAGCGIVSGLDLLLAQAVRQFQMFTHIVAPVDAMRAALQSAASARSTS